MSARPALLVTEVSDHGTDRTWRLAGAQVTNYVGPTLNAEGPNVIEELSLTVDSITIA
ncbi:MAG: hypothetical protein H7066_19690 [Cytophagaceae bacterium]|nr:hypothetical protein [Gemmatimonadaceae bacterium]